MKVTVESPRPPAEEELEHMKLMRVLHRHKYDVLDFWMLRLDGEKRYATSLLSICKWEKGRCVLDPSSYNADQRYLFWSNIWDCRPVFVHGEHFMPYETGILLEDFVEALKAFESEDGEG